MTNKEKAELLHEVIYLLQKNIIELEKIFLSQPKELQLTLEAHNNGVVIGIEHSISLIQQMTPSISEQMTREDENRIDLAHQES